MNLDTWRAVGIVSGALLAVLSVAVVVGRGVRTLVRMNMMIDQLMGNPRTGAPSILDLMAQLHDSVHDLAKKLDEHLDWHPARRR